MRYSLIKCAAVATLSVGIILAQAPTGNSHSDTATTQEGQRSFMHPHLEHMAQALDLTDSQKEQARMIFQQARESAQPIRQELNQNREKLEAAAKAGKSESDIEKLANDQGRLLGKLLAIRTEASAKFYRMLTPEQRIKADQMGEQSRHKVLSGQPTGH